jgi:superfamily II DNA or RNA helicase
MSDSVIFQTGDLVCARGREWVVLPSPREDLLRLRPLSGSDDDTQLIATRLEQAPVRAAQFKPPLPNEVDTQDGARLLADALRLSLRRGAGPFRSAAHLGVEPRAYQLVPLLMALKLEVKRLLIADDVGIGKTIEAAMIVREMLDRGQIDRFCVLCPPHLVDQWVSELSTKFDLDAVAVTAARARSLERTLPASQSLFDAYPATVVSLDYIKADSRRDSFALHCPELVIVDEAHTCVGAERGRHQRYELLQRLDANAERHMLLLTATPHSGNENAFDRLLGLLHPDFALGPQGGDANARERYATRLARQFVQRRRADIMDGEWHESRAFPKHLEREAPYALTGDFATFQEDVLDYCLGVTERATGAGRRLAFWGTLALMRCVGSSPAAAASALRNRRDGLAAEEALEPALFDEEEGLLTEGDIEPGTRAFDDEELAAIDSLIDAADRLIGREAEDPKYRALVANIADLVGKGARPIIFCRYIATAEAIGEQLARRFKTHSVSVVTGRLTPDERRARVEATREQSKRILVATDCLSEGINLQELYDAVVHYDLSWNPTRHQQREGRVDRYGQPSPEVRTVMMYGENSMIDGAVLEVITRKAEQIRKATGISVPVPEDNDSVANALMQAVLLRSTGARVQGMLDLFGGASECIDAEWRDAEEGAKASRARYAQGAMKPDEVLPEWRTMRALNGGPEEVARFTARALTRVGAPLEQRGGAPLVHFDRLPEALRERLAARGLTGTKRISFEDRPEIDAMHVGRVHPLVATLAEQLTEGALDSKAGAAAVGRCGAWRTNTVTQMTTVLLLRLRYKLTTSGRTNRLLLAEEATGLAFTGFAPNAISSGLEALALLERAASSNIVEAVIERRVAEALNRLDNYLPAIDSHAKDRARALSQDHERLTAAARGGATTTVDPVLPADVIGLYVLIPEAN